VVTVENAVVTVPAVPGGPGAAYFTLRTNNDPSRLVSITSPSIRQVELHTSRQQGGVSRMEPLQPGEATFSPSEPLTFAPGARHAMLVGMDPSLRPGGRVSLTFNVEPAAPVAVEARVLGPGQAHGDH
jgi:copper(I)-binding protein